MKATLINENVDHHNRAYRLWAKTTAVPGDLVDIQLTSTFSGAEKPDHHRVVWQATLPKEALRKLVSELQHGLNG